MVFDRQMAVVAGGGSGGGAGVSPSPSFPPPLTIPRFVRHSENPIFQASDSALGSIYWWSVQKVQGIIGNPLDVYYAWYSTDHAGVGNPGGVGLATAPNPLGPWTDRGLVWSDTTNSRSETEACVVMWDATNTRFNLYYKTIASTGAMFTHLATSTDGQSWMYNRQVLNLPGAEYPGGGNVLQGYFSPFRVGALWGAWTLLSGGTYPNYALAYSNDGAVWSVDPRTLSNMGQIGGGVTTRLSFEGSVPFHWDPYDWVVLRSSVFTSGTGGGGGLFLATLSGDYRQVVGSPFPALAGATPAWETTNLRSQRIFVDPDTGKVYLYYICANSPDTGNPVASGKLGVAIAEGYSS